MGRRALLIASGGLSHYPGTVHYPHPDVATDRHLYEQMRAGNMTGLLALDAQALDRTGNLELRAPLIAAGAMGNRKPFLATFEPSWHHTYSVLAWDLTEPVAATPLIYPALPPQRVPLVQALYSLRSDAASAQRYLADPQAWCDGYALTTEERQALLEMDPERLRDEFSIHALLTSGAATQLRIQRERS